MTLLDFGRNYLGGKSAKTAKRTILKDGIPYHKDGGGHILIRQSDAEQWRDARMQTLDLKAMLTSISDRILRERQRRPA
jgi:hypothetical protein